MTGLSIKQNGAFYGFSVEMSVAENVCECPLSYPERSVETGTIHGLIHTSKNTTSGPQQVANSLYSCLETRLTHPDPS